MDLSLFHLFLYATIILSAITVLGTVFYLKDRKRRLAESSPHMEMTPAERIGDIEGQIAQLRKRIALLEEEKKTLMAAPPEQH
jgi:hypothetical protein